MCDGDCSLGRLVSHTCPTPNATLIRHRSSLTHYALRPFLFLEHPNCHQQRRSHIALHHRAASPPLPAAHDCFPPRRYTKYAGVRFRRDTGKWRVQFKYQGDLHTVVGQCVPACSIFHPHTLPPPSQTCACTPIPPHRAVDATGQWFPSLAEER